MNKSFGKKVLEINPGVVMTYSDMANPSAKFAVVEEKNGEFVLVAVEDGPFYKKGELMTSDCRQAGWKILEQV